LFGFILNREIIIEYISVTKTYGNEIIESDDILE
jgi:hypothetical protein